jgi:hypothetical protein
MDTWLRDTSGPWPVTSSGGFDDVQAILQVGGKQAWEQLCSKGILADGFTLHLNGVALAADLGQWLP